MVGLPKSSREPGRIFISRNDGPGQDKNSAIIDFISDNDSAWNILSVPIAFTTADVLPQIHGLRYS